MKLLSAVIGGLAGATALTLIHEGIRRVNKDAPRMDLLGMEAIAKSLHKAGADTPSDENLYFITMAGDIISNSLYYSLAAFGKKERVILRGILLGLAAGIGAVYLPKYLGLQNRWSDRTTQTKAMAAALYLTGGLVSSAVIAGLEKNGN